MQLTSASNIALRAGLAAKPLAVVAGVKGTMKFAKTLIFLIILFGSSYASLWYGFTKGYEYKFGDNLSESVFTITSLNLIRDGKNQEAIESLESTLEINILSREISDKEFIKYIIGLPKPDDIITRALEDRIKKYKISTNYKCSSSKDVCELINGFIYDKR